MFEFAFADAVVSDTDDERIAVSARITGVHRHFSIVRLLDELTFITRALRRYRIAVSILSDVITAYTYFIAQSIKPVSVDVSIVGENGAVERSALCSGGSYDVEVNEWGTVDVIAEVDDTSGSVGLYRLNIKPRGIIPLHYHAVMNEAEFVLTDGLICNGRRAGYAAVHEWHRRAHTYTNTSDSQYAHILCIDIPKFIPRDEIRLDDEFTVADTPTSTMRWTPIPPAPLRFPGAFPIQNIALITDVSQFQASDAVLVVATNSAGHMLTVRNVTRGWELPGGKRDAHETDLECGRRECREESGYDITGLIAVAQYTAVEAERRHIKTVVLSTRPITSTNGVPTGGDTDASRFESAESLINNRSSTGYSPLLGDNVLELCIRLMQLTVE